MTHSPDLLPSSRRQFLRLGATGVAAAAVLAACSDDEKAPPSETGVTEPAPSETTLGPPQTTTPEAGTIADATVTRTARTMELAFALVYSALLSEGGTGDIEIPGPIDYDADTRAALELLRDRHQAHADALVDIVRDAGADAVSEPNNGLLEGIVQPQLADLTTERSVLLLAHSLEDLGAGTYGWGVGQVTSASLRESLMAIGSVTARHAAVVAVLLDPSGSDAVRRPVLDTSGPARVPDYMLVGPDVADGDAALAAPAPAGDAASDEEEEDDDGPTTEDSEPATTEAEG